MKFKTQFLLIAACVMMTSAAAFAADGKTLFEANCAKCHGIDGKGGTKMGQKAGCKDFTDAAYQGSLTDDKMAGTVKGGIKDGDKTKMKAFGDTLSADDIKAVVAYIRSFKK